MQKITAPVGAAGASNQFSDVKTIQELLNQIGVESGGPNTPLITDGKCGPKTITSIQNFQIKNFGWSMADGRIDPEGPTLAKLNDLLGAPPIIINSAGIYWGVDSFSPANTALQSGKTLYDYVVEKSGNSPAFWGRYIGAASPLNRDEIKFLLQERNCRIFIIYNAGGLRTNVRGNRQQGILDATNAITTASTVIGLQPKKIWIYADIEPEWSPSAEWISGWLETFNQSTYGGGFYCNTTGNRFNSQYCSVVNSSVGQNLRDKGLLFVQRLSSALNCNPNERNFSPIPPPCNPSSAVIWQYARNCYTIKNLWSVDMDLANQAGFDSMLR